VDDGILFRYEFSNNSATGYDMVTAITDPRVSYGLLRPTAGTYLRSPQRRFRSSGIGNAGTINHASRSLVPCSLICYIELPASDVARSAEFYRQVFGWNIRQRGDGHTAFDDTTGQVSGTWVLGRPPASAPGLLFYIMVDSVEATPESIFASEVVQRIGGDAPEITARFRDPGGNVIGLYQEPG